MSPSQDASRARLRAVAIAASDLAARVQRDGVHVGEARVAGLEPRRAREFSQRRVAAIQARQRQAERVVEHAALRRAREPVAKDAARHRRRDRCARYTSARLTYAGIEDGSKRIADCSSPSAAAASPRSARKVPRFDARLGAIGVVALRLDELGRRALERDLSLRAQLLRRAPRRAAAPPRCESRAAGRRAAARRVAVADSSGSCSTDCSAPKRTSALGSRSACRSASTDAAARRRSSAPRAPSRARWAIASRRSRARATAPVHRAHRYPPRRTSSRRRSCGPVRLVDRTTPRPSRPPSARRASCDSSCTRSACRA